MIICHCNNVTDRVIRQCIHDGNFDFDIICQLTGAALNCGNCEFAVEEIVEDEKDKLCVNE